MFMINIDTSFFDDFSFKQNSKPFSAQLDELSHLIHTIIGLRLAPAKFEYQIINNQYRLFSESDKSFAAALMQLNYNVFFNGKKEFDCISRDDPRIFSTPIIDFLNKFSYWVIKMDIPFDSWFSYGLRYRGPNEANLEYQIYFKDDNIATLYKLEIQ